MASLGAPRSAPGYFLTLFAVLIISMHSLNFYNPAGIIEQFDIGDAASARMIGSLLSLSQ